MALTLILPNLKLTLFQKQEPTIMLELSRLPLFNHTRNGRKIIYEHKKKIESFVFVSYIKQMIMGSTFIHITLVQCIQACNLGLK